MFKLSSLLAAAVLSTAAHAQAPAGGAATGAPPAPAAPATTAAPTPPDNAREKEADTCIRTKIWAGYDQGWAVRNATSAKLGAGEHRVYVITLEAGLEYKLIACGDKGVSDLDLVLHDATGKEVARDTTPDREPSVSFTAPKTESYYLAVFAAKLNPGVTTGGVATAVTYK